MIKLDGVNKIYNQGRENEVTAVQDVSLEIGEKQIVVFKGPSGSGKTSLLTMIGCLSRPSSGRVYLRDEIVSGLPEKFMTEVRRKSFGFVFQRFNLIRGLKVLENVMLPVYPTGPDHKALEERALGLLEMLEIPHKAHASIEHLSGGEAQRVAIARALINDPEVVIADEPTANLDTRLTGQFLEIAEKLHGEGKSLLISSHDPRVWQADIVDSVYSMEDGKIIDKSAKDHVS